DPDHPRGRQPARLTGRRTGRTPMTTTVLLTCFEPFGGDPENASEQAVALLAGTWRDEDVRLLTARLPVSFTGAGPALDEALAPHSPDAVVAVGEAGGRRAVTPETTARNVMDARIPDNDGGQPHSEAIDPTGPTSLPTRLDVEGIVRACVADGIAATVSHDAGAFVCNLVLHHLLRVTDVPAGFVHVPAVRTSGRATVGSETAPSADSPAFDSEPALTLEECARALGHAVRAAAAAATTARTG
ncbi:pyroglutamyl-peptidase I, partial [Nocardioides sp.]|uniref:pyroglutamyl-peptidase I n=1 Tax=Nocardioides sp. TaxID=35761 RepID=UPI002732426C